MQFGLSSYTYSWALGVSGRDPERSLTPTELVQRAHDLGVGPVPIVDNMPLHELSDDDLDALRELGDSLGIQFEVGSRERTPENLRRYLASAQRLQSRLLRFIPAVVGI